MNAFPARFDSGVCVRCKQPIRQGDAIRRVAGNGFEHPACQSIPELRGNPPATPAPEPSKWTPFEGKVMVVADKWGNEMIGRIVHRNTAPWNDRPGIVGWFIELPRAYASKVRPTYLRELRESDTPVREYVLPAAVEAE